MDIHPLDTPAFARYGRVLEGYPTEGLLRALRALPEAAAPVYQPREETLHVAPGAAACGEYLFGGMPWQMGYCLGAGARLTEMHYHRTSQFVLAGTALLLPLARVEELENGRLDLARAHTFRVPAGVAVELYAGSLHALQADGEPPRAVVGLPYASNSDFRLQDEINPFDRALWARNLWLLSRRDGPAAARGAFIGLYGEDA